MRNRLVTAILFIILGGLIALGPQTIFPVCEVHTAEQASARSTDKMDNQESTQMSGQGNMPGANDSGEKTPMTMAADTVMKCHWTARAELGVGFLIVLIGVFLIVIQSKQVRLGLSLSLVPGGILALLIPTALIGVCGGAHMPCRALALPALVILSSTVIAASAANTLYIHYSIAKGRTDHEAD